MMKLATVPAEKQIRDWDEQRYLGFSAMTLAGGVDHE